MKRKLRIVSFVFLSLFLTGCSHFNFVSPQNLADLQSPLKSKKDVQIEQLLMGSSWEYIPQGDDCKDTKWMQEFHKNRYYKSVGDACSISNAFAVEAENWHTKNKVLYMTNLSPVNGEDIILKYAIDYLDSKKMVLRSEEFKYTFKAVK